MLKLLEYSSNSMTVAFNCQLDTTEEILREELSRLCCPVATSVGIISTLLPDVGDPTTAGSTIPCATDPELCGSGRRSSTQAYTHLLLSSDHRLDVTS